MIIHSFPARVLSASLPLLALLATAGCRGGSNPGFNPAQEWGRIEKQAQDMRAVRAQMDDLRSQLDRWEAAAGDPKAAGLPSESAVVLQDRLEALRKDKHRNAATAFWDNLTLFLDRTLNDPRLKKAPEAARAVRLFSDESVALARERVREEGRYDRAAEVLEQALKHDPDYPPLKAELEKARSFQHLTRERFDGARTGMTMSAARDLCGVPAPTAVQERTEKGCTLTAWLYPRADGAWAALFFQDGLLYEKTWDAQPKP